MNNTRRIFVTFTFTLLLLLVLIGQWQLMEFTQISSGTDPSWMAVLGEANARGWRFGQDLIFTGGPLNFVYTHYYMRPNLALYIVCSLIFIVTLLIMWIEFLVATNFSFIAVVLVFLLCLSWGARDYLLISLPVSCIYFLLRMQSGIRFKLYFSFGVLSSALATLAKFSVFPISVMIFLLSDLYLIREKRLPFATVSYMLLLYITFIATSATGSDFWLYMVGSWRAASAYTMAMSYEKGSYHGAIDYVIFFLVLSPIIIFLCFQQFKISDGHSYVEKAMICLVALVFTWFCFKNGFVRHDGAHSSTALIGGCFGIMTLLMTSNLKQLSRVQQGILIFAFFIVTAYTAQTRIKDDSDGTVTMNVVPKASDQQIRRNYRISKLCFSSR